MGGRAGLGREVKWAHSLRPRPPAFEPLEGGELALLSSANLSLLEESMTLSYVVARLGEVQVAAIAVLGDVDEDAVETADAFALPLIHLPQGTTLAEVERAAIATIVDHQAELQRRAADIHRQLAQLTFEEKGLSALVSRLADLTGHTVAIEDDRFRLQFLANPTGLDLPPEITTDSSRQQLDEWIRSVATSATQPSVGRFPLADTSLVRFVAPITARDGLAGYLSLIGDEGELTELDRLATGRGAAVCALEVAKEAAVGEAESRVRGDLLDQLLTAGPEADQSLLNAARRLGYDPSAPSVVLIFRAIREKQGGRGTARSPETLRRQLEALTRLELSRREPKALVAARGSNIVVVVPVQEPTQAKVHGIVEDVRGRVEFALQDYLVAAGVSRQVVSGGLAIAYKEAEGALGVGVRLFGPSSTTYFGRLGIMRLLAQIDKGPELEGFLREMLGQLEEHDRRSGSELVRTLEAFFQSNGNLTRTAELLSLHRNSLLYRLRRIEEIGGWDLEDAEIRLSLQVALKIRQLLDAERHAAAF